MSFTPRSCFFAAMLVLAAAFPVQAQVIEYSAGGSIVGANGAVPGSLDPNLYPGVWCTFVFDHNAVPIDSTATSVTYGGAYGTFAMNTGGTEFLYNVTVRIDCDPVNGDYSYFFSGVTAEGWLVTHFAYGSDPSFVPSMELPTETPDWQASWDSGGYVDINGVDDAWAAYTDIEPIFEARVVSPTKGAPVLKEQPTSIVVREGKMAMFDVKVAGAKPVSYQWLKNGLPIPSETSRKLQIKKTTAADKGEYSVLVWNSAGVVLSQPASLSVHPKPKGGHAGPSPAKWEKIVVRLIDRLLAWIWS